MKTQVLPLDFQLLDANAEAVLVLGAARDLTLEIRNTSPVALHLNALKEPQPSDPHRGEHHFSLRFRAGVLRDHHIRLDRSDLADWKIDTKKEHGEHGDVLVQLRHRTMATWAAGQTLKLGLQGLRGEAAGGTRATRVELAYKHISSKNADGELVLVAGKPRHHQMVLTMPSPQEAAQRCLLEAHFVGATGNVVLNHGKPHDNALHLRLTNTTAQWLLIKPATELRVTLASGDESEPGALATLAQVQNCSLQAGLLLRDHEDTEAAREAADRGWIRRSDVALPCQQWLDGRQLADKRVWSFRMPENLPGPIEFTPDGSLDIHIGNIVTGNANGPSPVHVQWSNLSHPDADLSGELYATIQKSPLVVVGGKVGVGRIPGPDGPDLDSESVRQALALTETTRESRALATKAIHAVIDSSLVGRVVFVPWRFSEIAEGGLEWPTVRWDSLEVYWPGRGRIGIPWREHGREAWRELFEWCRRYKDPGYQLEAGQDYFERSPFEVLHAREPAVSVYPGDPAPLMGREGDRYYDNNRFSGSLASAGCTMGLPLKPNASLYARIDAEAGPGSGRGPVFFEDRIDAWDTRPLDSVFIARWDEHGVTAGCGIELGSSDQLGRLGDWARAYRPRPDFRFTAESLRSAPLPPPP
jgi:hypothetical protein